RMNAVRAMTDAPSSAIELLRQIESEDLEHTRGWWLAATESMRDLAQPLHTFELSKAPIDLHHGELAPAISPRCDRVASVNSNATAVEVLDLANHVEKFS